MITDFQISASVAAYIPKHMELLERVVFLVNEFTCAFVNEMPTPLFDAEKYDKELLVNIGKLLDISISKTMRPLVLAQIERDLNHDIVVLKLDWNTARSSLVIQNEQARSH